MFGFEKLTVWQKSMELNKDIYRLTADFPAKEAFGVISQMRRASVSVSLNIAEGAGRTSKKEFRHFLSMSYGSLCETVTLLILCRDLGYIAVSKCEELYSKASEISRMISGLSASKSL
ncbi:MAG: four helix bundle protein [Elusimicrobia bacterium]|nr:four helix bundle protein [Elusimicrobiota bacterium]